MICLYPTSWKAPLAFCNNTNLLVVSLISFSNAKVTTEGNIRVEILAAYYFGYLNNGTATIVPFRLVKKFNDALEKNGLIGEMYGMYVADLAQKFPILQLGNLLRRRPKVIYDFVPLYGEFNYALDY